MSRFLSSAICLIAIVAAVLLSPAVSFAQCPGGVCVGPPLVAMPGPVFGGPVFLAPAPACVPHCYVVQSPPVIVSSESTPEKPPGSSPPPVYQCSSGTCRPMSSAGYGQQFSRRRSVGIGLNVSWQSSGRAGGFSRWR